MEVQLLAAKNSTLELTQGCQIQTIKDYEKISPHVILHDIWLVGSKCGANNTKSMDISSFISGQWGCNGMEDIFLAHIGPLSTRTSLKHHTLPQYCFWSYPSFMASSEGCFQQDNKPKLKSSQTDFLNMAVSSLYSNGQIYTKM